jgi:hypothetical protein
VEAYRKHDFDSAWGCLLAARRMTIYGFSDSEREILARVLALEIATKCGSWRAAAAEALQLGDKPDLPRLIAAMELRDEHSQNQWNKIGRTRVQLQRLTYGLVAAVFVFIWVITNWQVPIDGNSPAPLLAVALMGVIGGCVSGVQNLGRATLDTKIPVQTVDSLMALTRPAVGAAAALAACFLLNLQVVKFNNESNAALFAICFAAGFTERLVVSGIEKITGRS